MFVPVFCVYKCTKDSNLLIQKLLFVYALTYSVKGRINRGMKRMVCTKCLHHKEGFESTKQKDNLSVLKLLHSTGPTDALIYNNEWGLFWYRPI